MKKLLFSGLAVLTLSFSGANKIEKASYYSDKYEGRRMANGEIFRQGKMVAASNLYPLGTRVMVVTEDGKFVEVKISDRLAKKYSNRIDLSKAAFKKLAKLDEGLINVTVNKL